MNLQGSGSVEAGKHVNGFSVAGLNQGQDEGQLSQEQKTPLQELKGLQEKQYDQLQRLQWEHRKRHDDLERQYRSSHSTFLYQDGLRREADLQKRELESLEKQQQNHSQQFMQVFYKICQQQANNAQTSMPTVGPLRRRPFMTTVSSNFPYTTSVNSTLTPTSSQASGSTSTAFPRAASAPCPSRISQIQSTFNTTRTIVQFPENTSNGPSTSTG